MLKHVKILVAGLVVVSSSTAIVAGCYVSNLRNCPATKIYYNDDGTTLKTCTLITEGQQYPYVKNAPSGTTGKVTYKEELTAKHCDYTCDDGTTINGLKKAVNPDGAACTGSAGGGTGN